MSTHSTPSHALQDQATTLSPWRWLAAALLVVLAVWLGWQAWERNLAEACRLNEWPYLQRCVDPATLPEEEQIAILRKRVTENPGDSFSWVKLSAFADRPGGIPGMDAATVIATAERLAPHHPHVLQMRSNRALVQKRWADALAPLIELTQYHRDSHSARVLALLMGQLPQEPALFLAMSSAVKADARWLDRVVRQMPQLKVPVLTSMPLVNELVEQDRLEPATGQFLIRQLKAEGHWLDAYGLWLHLWKRPMGLLFNGDFEQNFIPHGFDWEITDTNMHRAGAQVYQSGRGDRGQVLQVVFTGREIRQPMVRQHLLLTPGNYRLTGEFQSSELRSQNGLSWVLRCATGGKELGRSMAIRAQGRSWQKLDLPFTVTPDCGLGVEFSLRTQAPFEARAGIRGEILFDRFNLVQE